MKAILVILIIFVSSISFAEIYKWVDEKGTVHFTEDPATIPEKYQEKAKVRLTEEDLMSPEEKAKIRQEEDIKAKERRSKGLREDYEKRRKEPDEGRARKAREEVEAERLDIRVSGGSQGTRYGTKYIFTVEARNNGNRVKSISCIDFTLITEDNQSLSPEGGTLTSLTQIQPGTRTMGTVEFNGNRRAKTLLYNPTGETFSVR